MCGAHCESRRPDEAEARGREIFQQKNTCDHNVSSHNIFMQSENSKIWRPVLIFYAKVTSWIIFPLVLGVLLAKNISENTSSQVLFFVIIILGFMITCFGIYKELKIYKRDLEIQEKQKENGDK